ncbi:MAG: hypothetical protein LBG80_02585 [Bacteroidales bacterium]|jgi:hypothetical protein|nr:hypothetical protein [Bacteroidales bacterium]
MKAVIIMFYLCLFPFALVYSQSGIDSVCKSNNANIDDIYKVFDHKIKYEMVQYIYYWKKKYNGMPEENWRRHFFNNKTRGLPVAIEEQKDSISGVTVKKQMSDEEFNKHIEHCTPEQAFKEYKDLIRNIKSQKEIYLKCIDAEFAKAKVDSVGYAKGYLLGLYHFKPVMDSYMEPPGGIRSLNFLKIFKEFVLFDNEEVLPDGSRVDTYLKAEALRIVLPEQFRKLSERDATQTKEEKDIAYKLLILYWSHLNYGEKKVTYKLSRDEFLSKGLLAASYYDSIISNVNFLNNQLTDNDKWLRRFFDRNFHDTQRKWQEEAEKLGLK